MVYGLKNAAVAIQSFEVPLLAHNIFGLLTFHHLNRFL